MTRALRFGDSPEEQAKAHEIVSAIRDGHLDRAAGKPLYVEQDGTPVYRVLLGGLRWEKYDVCAYAAADGPRSWQVGRGFAGKKWGAVLFTGADISLKNPEIIGEDFRTMRLARHACEDRARRMPWMEGAPW